MNVPLNNKLQTLEPDIMDETQQKAARQEFETRWTSGIQLGRPWRA